MSDKLSDKSSGQLRAMLDKNSGASAKQVRSAINELKKRGEETPPPSLVLGGRKEMSKGGDMKKKKVPVISISVGMAELKKDPSKKAKMMRGGTANKKEHMYSAGGSVTDKMNPGLRALNKTRPDVVKKILS